MLANLNLNRDALRRGVPVPVVFWGPEFPVREIAVQAPDLWSGHADVFRFVVPAAQGRGALQEVREGWDWNLDAVAKAARHERLEQLTAELGGAADPRLRADLATARAESATQQSRYDDASALYNQALTTYHTIGDQLGVASTLEALGDLATQQNRHDDAEQFYDEALPINRLIGNQLGEANVLISQARLAHSRGLAGAAAELYDTAALVFERIGNERWAQIARAERAAVLRAAAAAGSAER